MKLLENSNLEALSSRISISAIDCILDLKVEAYSCKMIQSDKKQWKNVDNSIPADRQPLSPPDDFLSLSASPIGHSARMRHLSEPSCSSSDNDGEDILVDSISMRTLFDLRGVLSSAYSDYDFSEVKSSSFSLIPCLEDVCDAVDPRFSATVHDYPNIKDDLWGAVETEIEPSSCKIYGYKSEFNGDPFSEDGCMWGFSFIFFNKNLKRVLLISCRCLSQNAHNTSSELWDLDED
ncbi:unnamed protein product [Auanema sp. JU1783]|nr:unnamed protein product [Auanema sp. JU1783]